MADSNPDLDLGKAPGEGEGEEEKKGGGNLKLIIIVAVVALALGAGGAWFMMPAGEQPADGEVAEEVADAEEAKEEPEEAAPEAIYYDLEKPFVANLPEHHLVQVVVSVMSYEQKAIDQVKHHKAAISHEILLLLRKQTFEELSTIEAQETLRGEIRDAIQGIIRRTNTDPGIEEAYLTDFVIQ